MRNDLAIIDLILQRIQLMKVSLTIQLAVVFSKLKSARKEFSANSDDQKVCSVKNRLH